MTQEIDDPRAHWRHMPPPIEPLTWGTARDDDPVPGSVEAADAWERTQHRAAEHGG